jgi:hypothetical protein
MSARTAISLNVFALIVVEFAASGCSKPTSPSQAQNTAATSQKAETRPLGIAMQVAARESSPSAEMKETLDKTRKQIERKDADSFHQSTNHVIDELAQSDSFIRDLQRLKTGFPVVRPAELKQSPTWTKVTLNTTGARVDAIRFLHPGDGDADLFWMFAMPKAKEPQFFGWQISAKSTVTQRFVGYLVQSNLRLPDIDLPEENVVVFQQLAGRKIRPGVEYFIWFWFRQDEPIDMYLKMKVVETLSKTPVLFTKTGDFAEHLGLQFPFQFTSKATPADRAQQVIEREGVEAALETLERELATKPQRESEFYYVSLAHQHGTQFAEKGNEAKAQLFYLAAGKMLWRIRERHSPFSPQEQAFAALVFYNEACAFALEGEKKKAMASLQASVDSGFKDVAHMRGDDDLTTLHELSEFQELVKKLEATQ